MPSVRHRRGRWLALGLAVLLLHLWGIARLGEPAPAPPAPPAPPDPAGPAGPAGPAPAAASGPGARAWSVVPAGEAAAPAPVAEDAPASARAAAGTATPTPRAAPPDPAAPGARPSVAVSADAAPFRRVAPGRPASAPVPPEADPRAVDPAPPRPARVEPAAPVPARGPDAALAAMAPSPSPPPAVPALAPPEAPLAAAGTDAPAVLPPTRLPPAADWRYRLSRGGLVGSGRLRWAPGPDGSYRLELQAELPIVGTVLTQRSQGRVEAAGGLQPQRFTDRRLRRAEQAANFSRAPDGGLQVQFSGPPGLHALPPGSQDRLSVMVQIAALAAAWTAPPAGPLALTVVGARGDRAVWHLRVLGPDTLRLVGGELVPTLKLIREPEDPHDTTAELWLDPAHGHLPVRMRLSDGRSGEPLDLLRTLVPTD